MSFLAAPLNSSFDMATVSSDGRGGSCESPMTIALQQEDIEVVDNEGVESTDSEANDYDSERTDSEPDTAERRHHPLVKTESYLPSFTKADSEQGLPILLGYHLELEEEDEDRTDSDPDLQHSVGKTLSSYMMQPHEEAVYVRPPRVSSGFAQLVWNYTWPAPIGTETTRAPPSDDDEEDTDSDLEVKYLTLQRRLHRPQMGIDNDTGILHASHGPALSTFSEEISAVASVRSQGTVALNIHSEQLPLEYDEATETEEEPDTPFKPINFKEPPE